VKTCGPPQEVGQRVLPKDTPEWAVDPIWLKDLKNADQLGNMVSTYHSNDDNNNTKVNPDHLSRQARKAEAIQWSSYLQQVMKENWDLEQYKGGDEDEEEGNEDEGEVDEWEGDGDEDGIDHSYESDSYAGFSGDIDQEDEENVTKGAYWIGSLASGVLMPEHPPYTETLHDEDDNLINGHVIEVEESQNNNMYYAVFLSSSLQVLGIFILEHSLFWTLAFPLSLLTI
jgi:hypothetical protein